jgi:hypothetical protein
MVSTEQDWMLLLLLGEQAMSMKFLVQRQLAAIVPSDLCKTDRNNSLSHIMVERCLFRFFLSIAPPHQGR